MVFDPAHHGIQRASRVFAAAADTGQADHDRLVQVLVIGFRDRHVEAVAHLVNQAAQNPALVLERTGAGKIKPHF